MIDCSAAGQAEAESVPALMALEESDRVLGAPFFVMRHAEGFPVMGRPSLHEKLNRLGLDPDRFRT